MQVSSLETDSDPAGADLLIHVLNELTCPLDQKLRAFKMHTKVGARRLEVRFLLLTLLEGTRFLLLKLLLLG